MAVPRGVISKDALSNLKCSLCGYFLTVPPIFITSLKGDQYRCGRCPYVKTEVRVPANMFKPLASTTRFPCSHLNCKKTFLWDHIQSHEEKCMYRPMKCTCGETLEVHEAHQHFLKNHADFISRDRVIMENPEFSQLHMRCIIRNKEPFLVYVFCEEETRIRVEVYRLTNTLEEYEFNLEISSDRNMSKITIPNKQVKLFNVRQHCPDCLMRKCQILYHRPNTSRVWRMDKAWVSTSSTLTVLESNDFNLLITVMERGTHYHLQANFTKNTLLRSSWKCHSCCIYLTTQIYLDPNGQRLCRECKIKAAEASAADISEIDKTRNFALEEMAKQVQLACQRENIGCRFVGNVEKLANHQKKCYPWYRIF